MPDTVGIIGTGMIGCSIARALKVHSPSKYHLIGYSSGNNSQEALDLKIIDYKASSIEEVFQKSSIIILATPLKAMETIIQNSPKPSDDQLVIDCGSVKSKIIEYAQKSWQDSAKNFIASHPIAGKELSGPTAADCNLYKNARVIITPTPENTQQKINQAKTFWQKIGAKTYQLDAKYHDKLLSDVSHLPHILSFALVEGLFRRDSEEVFEWSAGGFKDFTRIASSDAKMWHDICSQNKTAIVNSLNHYIEDLKNLKQYIEKEDKESILKIFETAKKARDNFYN